MKGGKFNGSYNCHIDYAYIMIMLILSIIVSARSSVAIEMIILWGFISFAIILAPQFINYKTESVKVDDTEIISLKDNNNTEGKFFLGSGQIQNETYYYYMSENSKGFEMNKAIASSSFINESKEGKTLLKHMN